MSSRPGYRLCLAGLATILWMSTAIYVPILAPHAEGLGGSLGQVGIVLAAYGLSQMVLRLPLGLWSDRLGRRKVFVAWGFAAAAVSGVGLYLANTPASLAFYRFIAGMASTSWVALVPFFAAAWPAGQVVRAMGVSMAATWVGQMLGMYSGGLMAGSLGWRSPFLGAAALGVVGLVASLFLPEVRRPRPTMGAAMWRGLLRHPLIVASVLAAMAQYAFMVTAFGFTQSHAVRIGASEVELGHLGVAATLPAAVISLLLGGHWFERVGARLTLVVGLAFIALSTGVVPLIDEVGWLLAVQAVGAIARGITMPTLMGIVMIGVPEPHRGTAMGIYQSVYAFGMLVGPVVAGAIGNAWGLPAIFWTTGAQAALAAVVAFWLLRGLAPGDQ